MCSQVLKYLDIVPVKGKSPKGKGPTFVCAPPPPPNFFFEGPDVNQTIRCLAVSRPAVLGPNYLTYRWADKASSVDFKCGICLSNLLLLMRSMKSSLGWKNKTKTHQRESNIIRWCHIHYAVHSWKEKRKNHTGAQKNQKGEEDHETQLW